MADIRRFKLFEIYFKTIYFAWVKRCQQFILSQYNILIGNAHFLELGIGYLYCITNSNIPASKGKSLRIGYRFENICKKGIVFSAGFTPVLERKLVFFPNGSVIGGIALGYNFKN